MGESEFFEVQYLRDENERLQTAVQVLEGRLNLAEAKLSQINSISR